MTQRPIVLIHGYSDKGESFRAWVEKVNSAPDDATRSCAACQATNDEAARHENGEEAAVKRWLLKKKRQLSQQLTTKQRQRRCKTEALNTSQPRCSARGRDHGPPKKNRCEI